MEEKNYSPILPFDITQRDSFIIYDNTTYSMDINLVGDNPIQMNSPNMIKYYRCAGTEPVKIGGDDNAPLYLS